MMPVTHGRGAPPPPRRAPRTSVSKSGRPDLPGLRDVARRLLPLSVRRRRIAASFQQQVAVSGEAELLELGALVRPDDLALDIGANAGIYAWQLARIGARVIAFEPNPALADQIALLGNDRIDLRRVALSDRDGTATLALPHNDSGLGTLRSDLAGAGDPRFEVSTRRLDGLDLPRVGFIKIDVEGHEEAVLAGGAALLARDLPVLLIEIEERHNPGGLARITQRLFALGLSGWFLVDGDWHPIAEFAIERHQRVADIAPMDAGTPRRDCRYYNNFLFLPAGKLPPRSH
jgi:FkbM family methyltransferase